MKGNLNKKDIVVVALFGVFVLFGLYFAYAYFIDKENNIVKRFVDKAKANKNFFDQETERISKQFELVEPKTSQELNNAYKDSSRVAYVEHNLGVNPYNVG